MPSALVVDSLLTPVWAFLAVAIAPGMAAPVESVTSPVTCVVAVWPNARQVLSSSNPDNKRTRVFIWVAPSL